MKQVVLLSIPRMGYHGDRARAMGSQPKPYSDYEIHCREGSQELDKHTLIEEISGYDNYNSSVKDTRHTSNEAFQKGRKLARLICGSEQDLVQETYNTQQNRDSALAKLTRAEKIALGLA